MTRALAGRLNTRSKTLRGRVDTHSLMWAVAARNVSTSTTSSSMPSYSSSPSMKKQNLIGSWSCSAMSRSVDSSSALSQLSNLLRPFATCGMMLGELRRISKMTVRRRPTRDFCKLKPWFQK